jgi:hypothetical protein
MIADGKLLLTAIVLGVTVNNTSVSGVPSSVYTTFICLECAGLLIAGLLLDPSKIRRNDGRPIASFTPLPWYQELKALGLTLLEPKMALITLSIYSSEMYLSLTGAFNAWYFNARTRSLANVSRTLLSYLYLIVSMLISLIVLLLDLPSSGSPCHCMDLRCQSLGLASSTSFCCRRFCRCRHWRNLDCHGVFPLRQPHQPRSDTPSC